jgi:hypothetical protein
VELVRSNSAIYPVESPSTAFSLREDAASSAGPQRAATLFAGWTPPTEGRTIAAVAGVTDA